LTKLCFAHTNDHAGATTQIKHCVTGWAFHDSLC